MEKDANDRVLVLRVLTLLTIVYKITLPELHLFFGVSVAELEAFMAGSGALSDEHLKKIRSFIITENN